MSVSINWQPILGGLASREMNGEMISSVALLALFWLGWVFVMFLTANRDFWRLAKQTRLDQETKS